MYRVLRCLCTRETAHAQYTSLLVSKQEMTSSESSRTKAYAEDLRWKIVWQSQALSLSQKTVGKNLGVDRSTVSSSRTAERCRPESCSIRDQDGDGHAQLALVVSMHSFAGSVQRQRKTLYRYP